MSLRTTSLEKTPSPSLLIGPHFKTTLAFMLALLVFATTLIIPPALPLFAQASTTQSGNAITTTTYTVKRGDTLGAIARSHNTTVAALLRLNPQIRNPNQLYVGQRIQVPVPAQEPGGFTITHFHLLSLNDGGPVGCGDTLVPVTVEIPATRGILRATLEKLLGLHTQYYGESGLYNALYQSQLAIEDVRIDNRVATIRLTGQIVLGGVCDAPRVQSQLEQAALQFSTVDQVKVYINGKPLQEVLSQK